MKKVLVVDDEVAIHQLISAIIRVIPDVEVLGAYDGREALAKALAEEPDLIISDVNMPDLDGLQLCQQVRESPSIAETPILLLTARADTQDKYHGFLQGADDYIVKPFDATELQFRIKALLRRSPRAQAAAPAPETKELQAGPLTLNLHRYLAMVEGEEVRLTGSEFAILRYLAEHPDQVIAVDTLLSGALDYPPRVGNPQVIHTHMKNIRSKLRSAGVEPTFLTSSRRGYMLVVNP